MPTREFLNVLDSTLADDTPFLYYSDHDVQGGHIFTVLKYGCKSTAWASDIQVCPRLTWAGPTKAQFFEHHQGFHPDQASWPARRRALDRKMVKKHTRVDDSLMRCMNNLHLLDDEDVLRSELENMNAGLGVSCWPTVSSTVLSPLAEDPPCLAIRRTRKRS